MKDPKWNVIGRGKVGWFAEAKNLHGSGGTLEGYVKEAYDGAFVYDASNADLELYVKHVVDGPMLDPGLEPHQVSRFGKEARETAAFMMPGLGGSFKTLASEAVNNPLYSGLDYVGLGVYESLLRSIPGIKFGKVQGGEVHWE